MVSLSLFINTETATIHTAAVAAAASNNVVHKLRGITPGRTIHTTALRVAIQLLNE